jgi:hypothetical protein
MHIDKKKTRIAAVHHQEEIKIAAGGYYRARRDPSIMTRL